MSATPRESAVPDRRAPAPGTGRRRFVAISAWLAAFVAWWALLGLPLTDPILAYAWLWLATVAWRTGLPWRQHMRFGRDWAPVVLLLEGYNLSRGFADNGATPHGLEGDRTARCRQPAQRRAGRVEPGRRDAVAAQRIRAVRRGVLPVAGTPAVVAAAAGLPAGDDVRARVLRRALPDRRVGRLGVRGAHVRGRGLVRALVGYAPGALRPGTRHPRGHRERVRERVGVPH